MQADGPVRAQDDVAAQELHGATPLDLVDLHTAAAAACILGGQQRRHLSADMQATPFGENPAVLSKGPWKPYWAEDHDLDIPLQKQGAG